LLEVGALRTDALAAEQRFGVAGISMFAAPDEVALDELASGRLVRFDVLTLMAAGVLRRAGLDLLPTFRRPHYTLLLPELDADLRTLLACDNVIRINPHYVRPEVS
jgi:hypothetical protein